MSALLEVLGGEARFLPALAVDQIRELVAESIRRGDAVRIPDTALELRLVDRRRACEGSGRECWKLEITGPSTPVHEVVVDENARPIWGWKGDDT